MDDGSLPPRYGFVTSNSVESTNSMFDSSRKGPWLNAIKKTLFPMTRRISQLRKDYCDYGDDFPVPMVEEQLRINYDMGAAYSVVETNEGRYLVTYESETGNPAHRSHMLTPEWGSCTCGKWQDMVYPCRHACAYARKIQNESFDHVKDCYVGSEQVYVSTKY